MPNVAVILSGCGHQDGAEIREAVLSLLYLDEQGAQVECFAPDIAQTSVVNHAKGSPESGQRNVLAEAARIARGAIKPLSELKPEHFNALVLPGGFGAAKNLSDFAHKGKDCAVLPQLQSVIRAFHAEHKPIAAICIAPAVVAAALKGVAKPQLTIGEDKGVASALEAMGAVHRECATRDCLVDKENAIITTPAYMRDDRLSAVAEGIEKAIHETLALARLNKQKSAA